MKASTLLRQLPNTKEGAENFANQLTEDSKGGLITIHKLVSHLAAMEVVIEIMKDRINKNPSLK